MPRPIDHVHSEIIRIAEDLGLNPRSKDFTRSKFLSEDNEQPTDVTKHDLEYLGGWARLKHDAAHCGGLPPDTDTVTSRGVDLRNLYVRKLERKAATAEYFHDKLIESFKEVFENNPIGLVDPTFRAKKSSKPKERVLTLLWSDLHFGVEVKDYETYGSNFDWTIAARRMAKLCREAVDWREPETTTLRVVLNGDILHGVIHLNDSNIRPMTEQIWGATAILTGALDFLRMYFNDIQVECLPGNHDRMTYKGYERATAQRWDSHAHSLYLALMAGFREDPGIKFNVPTTGISLMDDLTGGYILASHGDTAPESGNVAKSINSEKIAVNLLKLRDSNAIDKPVSVALFGHWHTPTIQMLPNGTMAIINGSLIGSDSYGQNVVGEFNSQPAQVMFESVPGNPVNAIKIIKVRDADSVDSEDVIKTPLLIEDGSLVM